MGIRAGLSAKETLFMTPGEVFDLWELYLDENGLKEEQEDVLHE